MKQVSKLLSIKYSDTNVLKAKELINLKGGQLASQIGCPPPIGVPPSASALGEK